MFTGHHAARRFFLLQIITQLAIHAMCKHSYFQSDLTEIFKGLSRLFVEPVVYLLGERCRIMDELRVENYAHAG